MPEYKSVFEPDRSKVWSHVFDCQLHVADLTGGYPLNPDVIEGWLKSKITENDDLLQAAIAESMAASTETLAAMGRRTAAETKALKGRADPLKIEALEGEVLPPVSVDQAIAVLARSKSLKGFKRDEQGLYVEGRQVKAMLKEAMSIAVQGGHVEERGWGKASNKKWLKGFAAEHVQVPDIRVYISGSEHPGQPDEVRFDFVHASGRHGFKQSEVIWDAELNFTVETDYEFEDGFWRTIWLIAEQQGIGADRSQGQGRFTVTRWEERK
jgi:hypothetical protein